MILRNDSVIYFNNDEAARTAITRYNNFAESPQDGLIYRW